MSSNSVYWVVRKGREKGIFLSMEECEAETKGYEGAEYHGFEKIDDAKAYLAGKELTDILSPPTKDKGSKGFDQDVLVYTKDSDDGAIETMSRASSFSSNGEKPEPIPQKSFFRKSKPIKEGPKIEKFDVKLTFSTLTGIKVVNASACADTTVAFAARIAKNQEGVSNTEE